MTFPSTARIGLISIQFDKNVFAKLCQARRNIFPVVISQTPKKVLFVWRLVDESHGLVPAPVQMP